ncbi:cathepsin B [Tetranychus urticae]|uniref:Peptidase C1A papain C-terminal domain-containing protein n=1 Tax=Tetranychus urticae TaxID=32264 RepID=T1KCU9_TETUR|nr:cathepsin B [Tetranychus urticae]
MKSFIAIVLSICFVKSSGTSSDALESLPDELIELFNSNGTTWKAGKNFDGLSLSQVKKLFMSSEETLTTNVEQIWHSDSDSHKEFDARTEWPHCPSIGQIFNQGFCSPSWIYASVGQMADRICIKTGQNIDVKATVEHMMNGNYDCNSNFNTADGAKAFRYWSTKGIFIEKPEKSSNQCRCQIKMNDEYFGVSNYRLSQQLDIIKEILSRGPITFHIEVYLDLLYYKSGVYQRTSDVKLGSHLVKVIGWGVENGVDYWLIANSWGTKWGDNGFFKLKRGVGALRVGENNYSALIEKNTKVPSTMDKEQLFLVAHKCSCGCDKSW